jgi:hypothetical protein
MTGDKPDILPFPLASPALYGLNMGVWLMYEFWDSDRIFDAIIYTSKADNIMRYSDEVRV